MNGYFRLNNNRSNLIIRCFKAKYTRLFEFKHVIAAFRWFIRPKEMFAFGFQLKNKRKSSFHFEFLRKLQSIVVFVDQH